MVSKALRTLFGALANPTRLAIVERLLSGEKNVSELIRLTGASQSMVSHCLKRLIEADLVAARRQGKYRMYALNERLVRPLLSRLAETEGRWKAVMDYAPNYIILIDTKFRITYLNRLAPGVRPEMFIGKPLLDLVAGDQARREAIKAFRKALRTGKPSSYLTMNDDPVIGKRWYAWRVGAIKEGGRVKELVIIAMDITEYRQAAP